MNCCKQKTRGTKYFRRGLDVASWIIPSVILALMPKCPACLAVYVAIGTGIGLSISTAWYLQTGLIVLCGGSLAFLALRLMRQTICHVLASE